MRRLGIFFFYDNDGIVDNYVDYYLKSMKPFYDEICAVVNGSLSEDGRQKLGQSCSKILVRENEGLDATAYKCAIENYGYEKLTEYDEVTCFNFTCFGPFYDLTKMFQEMETRDCDWWSLYKCTMQPPYVEGEHLPSFFITYRKSMLSNPKFKEYWDSLPKINSYNDSVMYHEERQTPYFDKAGFKREVYFDFTKYDFDASKNYWPLSRADELITNEQFPFLKRRNLYVDNKFVNFRLVKNSLDYIRKNTSYDTNMIAENIIRTQDIKSLDLKKKHPIKEFKWKIFANIHPNKKQRAKYKEKITNVVTSSQYINYLKRDNNEK